MLLSLLADKLGLLYSGNPNRDISRVSSPDDPDTLSICPVWDKAVLAKLPPSAPVIMKQDYFNIPPLRDGLICDNPRAILPELLALFAPTQLPKGSHHSAVISPQAHVSPNSYIGPNAYIGPDCFIGDFTVVEPNAVLLANVKTGTHCLIHSGAVLGCDGFGFERTPKGLVKIPQTGGVTLGDNVEIGACTAIDRGTFNDTVIGSGTKIDNHVQIGHNVKIGRNCIICAMSGVAGSSVIEDNVTVAVQAGITDHVTVGKNSVIAGRSGVTNDVPEGSVFSGFPARNHNDAKRALVLACDLPLIVKRLKTLEKKLEALLKSCC